MLVRVYGPLVYRWARNCELQPENAADLTRTVFHSVRQGLNTFTRDHQDASFRNWVRALTYDAVRSMSQKRRLSPKMEQILQEAAEAGTEFPSANRFASNLFGDLSQHALHAVQATVDETTWKAFLRIVIHKDPVGEAAQRLGISEAAARQSKYQVLYRMRTLLADR